MALMSFYIYIYIHLPIQVVRGAVPKSIAIPAAESEASVQAEIEKKKNKKEIEAGIAARDSALKKKGDIS